jgi:hypothetical protein
LFTHFCFHPPIISLLWGMTFSLMSYTMTLSLINNTKLIFSLFFNVIIAIISFAVCLKIRILPAAVCIKRGETNEG